MSRLIGVFTLLVALGAAACAQEVPPLGPPEPPLGADGSVALSADGIALVVARIDAEIGEIRLVNRSDRPIDLSRVSVRSRSDEARPEGALAAFAGVSVPLYLDRASDYVYVSVDGEPVSYAPLGAPGQTIEGRDALWTGDALDTRAHSTFVLAHGSFFGIARSAAAYAPTTDDAVVHAVVVDLAGHPIAGEPVDVSCGRRDPWTAAGSTDSGGTFRIARPRANGLCFLRIAAGSDEHVPLVRPFIPDAAELGEIALARYATTAARRVAPDTLAADGFAGGDPITLTADPRDLDAIERDHGYVYVTVVPGAASSSLRMDPTRFLASVAVHGPDRSRHVEFVEAPARLRIPIAPSSAPDLAPLDSTALLWRTDTVDAERATPEVFDGSDGVVVLSEDALTYTVHHFSVQSVSDANGGTWRATEAEDIVDEPEVYTCECGGLSSGRCPPVPAYVITIGQSDEAGMERSRTTGFSGEVSGDVGSLSASFEQTLTASMKTTEDAGSTKTCQITLQSQLCFDGFSHYRTVYRITTFAQHTMQPVVRAGAGEVGATLWDLGALVVPPLAFVDNPFEEWRLLPTGASITFRNKSGCDTAETTYRPEYARCNCVGTEDDTWLASEGWHGEISATWPTSSVPAGAPPSACPSTGVVSDTMENSGRGNCSVAGVTSACRMAYSGTPVGDSTQGGLAEECQRACAAFDGCDGRLIGTPGLSISCTESDGWPRDYAYSCTASSVCECFRDTRTSTRCAGTEDCDAGAYCALRPEDEAFACHTEGVAYTGGSVSATAAISFVDAATCGAAAATPFTELDVSVLAAVDSALRGEAESVYCGATSVPVVFPPDSVEMACEGSDLLVYVSAPLGCG